MRTARLWLVKEIEIDDLNDFEAYSEFEERIRGHSDGEVGCQDVMNQTCCRGCLYIITECKSRGQPAVSISILGSTVDRFLVRSILYSLEPNPLASHSSIVTSTASKDISAVAKDLRGNYIPPSAESKLCMRMLPFAEVLRARKRLSIIQQGNRKTYLTTIDSRTV